METLRNPPHLLLIMPDQLCDRVLRRVMASQRIVSKRDPTLSDHVTWEEHIQPRATKEGERP